MIANPVKSIYVYFEGSIWIHDVIQNLNESKFISGLFFPTYNRMPDHPFFLIREGSLVTLAIYLQTSKKPCMKLSYRDCHHKVIFSAKTCA